MKHNDDINGAEILSEVGSLKFQCSAIVEDVQSALSINLLNASNISGLQEVYPNINIALRLFLTLSVTVATCERNFGKLKLLPERMNELIQNSLYRSCFMTGLALISIEHVAACRIDYVDLIHFLSVPK